MCAPPFTGSPAVMTIMREAIFCNSSARPSELLVHFPAAPGGERLHH